MAIAKLPSHRVQFILTNEAYEQLREIRERSGLSTNTELFRKAIHLFGWLMSHRREGWELQLVRKDEKMTVAFL